MSETNAQGDDLWVHDEMIYPAANARKSHSKPTFDFSILPAGSVSVVANAAKGAKLRSMDGEVLNQPIGRLAAQGSLPGELAFETKIGGSRLGVLEIAPNENGFAVGWWSREIDQGQKFAIELSGAKDPAQVVLNHPDVNSLVYLPEKGQFLANFKGSSRWMYLAEDANPPASLPTGWQSRVADPENGLTGFLLKWEEGAAGELKGGFLASNPSKPNVWVYTTKPPQTGLQPVEFQVGEFKLGALVDPKTKSVFFETQKLPKTFQEHPELLKDTLGATSLPDELSPGLRISVRESAMGEFSPLAQDVAEGNYPGIAHRIADNPLVAQASLDDCFRASLKRIDQLSLKGDPAELVQKLDQLEKVWGPRPEIMLRKGLLQLERGQVQEAAQVIDKSGTLGMSTRSDFFDEINFRLSSEDISQVEQENVYRLAEYADWKNTPTGPLAPAGKVTPFASGDRLGLELRLPEPLQGNPLKVGQFQKNVPVYVQDSPALNNLDWQTSVEKSMNEVVSGDLGEVKALTRQDIAHFNPTRIYDPTGRILNLKTPIHAGSFPSIYIPYSRPCKVQDNCDREKENDLVYVVMAKP